MSLMKLPATEIRHMLSWQQAKNLDQAMEGTYATSVSDPYHFDADPRIRFRIRPKIEQIRFFFFFIFSV